MTKLFSVLLFSLLLLSAFVIPAAASAAGCTVTFSNITVVQVTDTTATINVQVCETGVNGNLEAGAVSSATAIQLGTEPGKYTTTLHLQSAAGKGPLGDRTTFCFTGTTILTNLDPCTTYYFRFYSDLCPTRSYSREFMVATTGCPTPPIGQGSSGSAPCGPLPGLCPPTQMSNIVVKTAAISTAKVGPGQPVDVTATVVNSGTTNGAAKVTLYVNGEQADASGLTLASGQSTPVHFQVSRNEPGTYSVYVNGVSAGNFTVDTFANNDILIYAAIAIVTLGVAGTLYFVTRKRTAK